MSSVRKDHVSLEETKASLYAVAKHLGRNPLPFECQEVANKLGVRIYKRISRYYPLVGATDYYSFLSCLGFENLVRAEEGESTHYSVLSKIYPGLKKEIPFKIEGSTYRVDYCIQHDGKTLYVEVDGASHYTIKSKHLKIAACSLGVSVESLLDKRIQRDLKISNHLKTLGLVLVRFNYHELMSMSPEKIKETLGLALAGVEKSTRADRLDDRQVALDLILEGVPILEASKRMGYGETTLRAWVHASEVKIPDSLYVRNNKKRMGLLGGIIKELAAEGLGAIRISKYIPVSTQAINLHMKRLGISPAKNPTPDLPKALSRIASLIQELRELQNGV